MVDLIPKQIVKTPLWKELLFYLSLAFFLAIFGGYFVLDYYYNDSKESLAVLKSVLQEETPKDQAIVEKEVKLYEKKIKDFSSIIESHYFASSVFPFLEDLSHSRVWFSSFKFEPGKFTVTVSGTAEDLQTLGEQFLIFQRENLITEVILSNTSIGGDEGVGFSFNISIDPEVFKL